MSSCKSWIQTVHGMKLKLCTSFFAFFSSSFQFLTFPCFFAFLFPPSTLGKASRWNGAVASCGMSSQRVEQIWSQSEHRSEEGKALERERERIVKVWMGSSKRDKGGEDGEEETVRGGASRERDFRWAGVTGSVGDWKGTYVTAPCWIFAQMAYLRVF